MASNQLFSTELVNSFQAAGQEHVFKFVDKLSQQEKESLYLDLKVIL